MLLLREFIKSLLLLSEGRIEDVKKKYPDVDVHKLAQYDPSGNNAYLAWMAKQAATGNNTDNEIRILIQTFHKYKESLKQRDINSFKDLSDLRDALSNIKMPKVSGTHLVAQNSGWFALHIKTKSASINLGARDTSWCITQSNRSYWEEYTRQGAIFFFCIRKIPEHEGNDKFAISVIKKIDQRDVTEFWTSSDKEISRENAESFLSAELIGQIEAYAAALPEPIEMKIYRGEVNVEELDAYVSTLSSDEIDKFFSGFEDHKTEKMTSWVKSKYQQARLLGLKAMTPVQVYKARDELLSSDDRQFVAAVIQNLPVNFPEYLEFAGSEDYKIWSNVCTKLIGSRKADFVEAAFAADKTDFINKFFRNTPNINGFFVAALLKHSEEIKAQIASTCADRIVSDIAFPIHEDVLDWEQTIGEKTLIDAIRWCSSYRIDAIKNLAQTKDESYATVMPPAVIQAAKLRLSELER